LIDKALENITKFQCTHDWTPAATRTIVPANIALYPPASTPKTNFWDNIERELRLGQNAADFADGHLQAAHENYEFNEFFIT
jgi:hypothetical protein